MLYCSVNVIDIFLHCSPFLNTAYLPLFFPLFCVGFGKRNVSTFNIDHSGKENGEISKATNQFNTGKKFNCRPKSHPKQSIHNILISTWRLLPIKDETPPARLIFGRWIFLQFRPAINSEIEFPAKWEVGGGEGEGKDRFRPRPSSSGSAIKISDFPQSQHTHKAATRTKFVHAAPHHLDQMKRKNAAITIFWTNINNGTTIKRINRRIDSQTRERTPDQLTTVLNGLGLVHSALSIPGCLAKPLDPIWYRYLVARESHLWQSLLDVNGLNITN